MTTENSGLTAGRIVRPRKWTRFKTNSFQHFIISAKKEGMSRARVEQEWIARLPPSQRDRLTNSEWAHVKKWLASLGYYYNRRFFWIHPHYRNKEIPLIPLQFASDPMPDSMRGSRQDNLPTHLMPLDETLEPVVAPETKMQLRPVQLAGPNEIVIPEHTRADGKTVVKEHIRKFPVKNKLEPSIEEVIEEMAETDAEHSFINPDDGRGGVKTVRITVPRGVKVMIHYD